MVTLVTGGTGLVGNNILRLLLARGQRVRVLAREQSDPRPLAGLDVEIARGDIRDPAAVRRAFRDAERVIHCAARVHIGWSDPGLHQAVNVDGTRNVADTARSCGARMVHVSSVDALGAGSRENPADEDTAPGEHIACGYVVTKRAAERIVLEQVVRGLDAVIVNPAYMLGPWDWKPSSGRMLLAVARRGPLLAPPGGNDFCDVRDVSAGVLSAAERGRRGARYILGGQPLSYLEAWRIFAKVAGVRRPIGMLPRWMPWVAGRAGDAWGRLTGREPDINSAATAFSNVPHHFSAARARAELDYAIRPVEESVQAAWDWFRANRYA